MKTQKNNPKKRKKFEYIMEGVEKEFPDFPFKESFTFYRYFFFFSSKSQEPPNFFPSLDTPHSTSISTNNHNTFFSRNQIDISQTEDNEDRPTKKIKNLKDEDIKITPQQLYDQIINHGITDEEILQLREFVMKEDEGKDLFVMLVLK